MDAGFDPKQMKEAGFDAVDLLFYGCAPLRLVKSGFTFDQVREAMPS